MCMWRARQALAQVYALTATVSVLAYVWLVLVLMVISPDVVDSWEAALTFIFFWLLLASAYVLDKNFFREASHAYVHGLVRLHVLDQTFTWW